MLANVEGLTSGASNKSNPLSEVGVSSGLQALTEIILSKQVDIVCYKDKGFTNKRKAIISLLKPLSTY
jgi:hypothetical protein